MHSKKDIIKIINILKYFYPDARCSLNFQTPFELLVATILSAQCTDERVNKTTPLIFCNYSTPLDFVNIELSELEELVHPCGFYKNKAKNIKSCAEKIINDYNGIVPNNINDLLTLPGVGKKTANVVMLEAFGIAQGIAIDTHAKRISNLIGLSNESDPIKIETDLLKIIPNEYLKDINHLFMWHGRNICVARNPKCNECPINKYCRYYSKKQMLHKV